jgi:2,3-bisphosphoglycerate-independent phosphoglycerate mutase
MGNSEVGHNALGAGRVFSQGASLVQNAIDNGEIFKTDIWKDLTDRAKNVNNALHFIGLLSDGNVHSHILHLLDMCKRSAKDGVKKIRIHILLDGRDVYERSALKYVEQTEMLLSGLNEKYSVDYRIASGGGRMVTTMDRYNADWNIVKKGWHAHVLGKARKFKSAKDAIQTYYDADPKMNDQFLDSFVVCENERPIGTIEDGDSVVFFNFRGDRAIEISMAFEDKEGFDKFDREMIPDVLFAGMMEYDGDMHVPKNYLVVPPQIDKTVGEYLCGSNVKSFALSETQKYGHVTYFWNGNKSGYINKNLEEYFEIPSDKIQFQNAPKMKSKEITDMAIELFKSGKYKFGRINFPNGDMVGHTGKKEAIITAVEAVDESVARLIDTVNALDGIVLITADHGNADEMFTVSKGQEIVSTAHSLNKVPFAIIDKNYNNEYSMADLESKGLSNVAATIVNLLGFEKPAEYDPSLIVLK